MARYDWPATGRRDDNQPARERHMRALRPNVDPTTIAPLTPRRRDRRRRAQAPLSNAPSGDQNLWFPIGPSVMTHGQADGDPNVAGRIRDLQVEPTQGMRIYAASATGGVWFSADGGQTWAPLDDFQESDRTDVGNAACALACGALYVKFGGAANGSQDVVWVGTGEPSLTEGGLPGVPGGEVGGGLPGGQLAGIGFLHRDPALGPGWRVEKGDPVGTDADTLRGKQCYRIAADPANHDPANPDQLVAGTTKGLYLLPAPKPGEPAPAWIRVTTYPMALAGHPLDVVLTRPTANTLRIWVGVPSGVLVAESSTAPATPVDPASLAFTPIGLPNVKPNRAPRKPNDPVGGGTRVQLAVDGTTLYVLGRRAKAKGEKVSTPPAHLWSIDTAVKLADLRATEITGLPAELFMSTDDQSDYDMCIAVHPSAPGQLYVGGAATGNNGALYRCQVSGATVTPTPIGKGVHPDLHVIRFGPAASAQRSVWVGCDGGLFRSDSDGDPGTFVNRNDGLAVLQPGYVASHPTNPGLVVAGFQDNGTAVRVGDTLWEEKFPGDGGGVVFDPAATDKVQNDGGGAVFVPGRAGRYFYQYFEAAWHSSDGSGVAPVLRGKARQYGTVLKTSETTESESSRAYSGADAVVAGDDTHLAFGSDRVWYSRNWGRSWVTLPTATDPRSGDNPHLAQDVLATIGVPGTYIDRVGSTECCATNQVGTAIIGNGIIAVKFALAPNDSDKNLRLRVLALYPGGLVWFTGTRAPPPATGAFTWARPAPRVEQAIRDPKPGTETDNFRDGKPLAFLPAAPAPGASPRAAADGLVSDVAVHKPGRGDLGSCYVTTVGGTFGATQRDTLWFFDGKDKWYPTGLRLLRPGGTWKPGQIRVTAPALGVVVDPSGDGNVVYVGTSVGVVKGTLTIGGTETAPTYAWEWEQFMNGLPEAAVQDLSIRQYGNLTLLRAALQARGVWETDVANPTASPLTYLRVFPTDTRRILPSPTSGAILAGDRFAAAFDDSPDIVVDVTGTVRTAPPTEAEMAKIPPPGLGASRGRVEVADRHPEVHVLVHHRWSEPAPAAAVRVALLRHDLPASGAVPIGGLWPALVDAAPSGTEPAPLPDGWSAAAGQLWKPLGGPVEPRLPRAVTFTLDLSAVPSGSAILLLAVVMSATNPIDKTADLHLSDGAHATTADQLVFASPHVAAKSISVR
jgi:hypothetical protein